MVLMEYMLAYVSYVWYASSMCVYVICILYVRACVRVDVCSYVSHGYVRHSLPN